MVKDGFDITDRYIRARQEEQNLFNEDSFRTITLAPGVKAIVGRLKGSETTTIQSILFDRKDFDEEKAQRWLNKHGTKMSKALEIETAKMDLFMDTSEDAFFEHLEGHIPPLSPNQIQRLLELIGPDNDEDFEYQFDTYGRLI